MAKYEILYIIRPNIEEEAKNALVARFDLSWQTTVQLLLNQKIGKNVVLRTKFKISVKGLYHVINVETEDATALNEFDRLSKSTVTFFVTWSLNLTRKKVNYD